MIFKKKWTHLKYTQCEGFLGHDISSLCCFKNRWIHLIPLFPSTNSPSIFLSLSFLQQLIKSYMVIFISDVTGFWKLQLTNPYILLVSWCLWNIKPTPTNQTILNSNFNLLFLSVGLTNIQSNMLIYLTPV